MYIHIYTYALVEYHNPNIPMDFALWHFRCLFHNQVLRFESCQPAHGLDLFFFQLVTESQERYCGWWKKSTSWLSLHIYINRICVQILYTYEIEYWCNRKISESSVVDTCFSQAPFNHLMWSDEVCWGGTPYVSHGDFSSDYCPFHFHTFVPWTDLSTQIDSPISSRVKIDLSLFPAQNPCFFSTVTAWRLCGSTLACRFFRGGHRLGTLHLHTNVPWSKNVLEGNEKVDGS